MSYLVLQSGDYSSKLDVYRFNQGMFLEIRTRMPALFDVLSAMDAVGFLTVQNIYRMCSSKHLLLFANFFLKQATLTILY